MERVNQDAETGYQKICKAPNDLVQSRSGNHMESAGCIAGYQGCDKQVFAKSIRIYRKS
jgi:hypothetical protein